MIHEQLVRSTVIAAVCSLQEEGALERILSRQAAQLVGQILNGEANVDGSSGRISRADSARVGWDESREEGRADVPWYAR
jgi:hypothetical protein